MKNHQLMGGTETECASKNQKPPAKTESFDMRKQRVFERIIKWQAKLEYGPQYQGILDPYSGDPYCVAFRHGGISFMRVMLRLAGVGHKDALRQLLFYIYEAVEKLETLGESQPEMLSEFAQLRADWPVMLCRHESSNKLVSSYLDRIHLGTKCLINADGTNTAKYSLRTPINRFVWRKLKRMPFSIALMSDVPEIAAINLKALPELTKATAKIWADKALMPYICAMIEDFSKVPAFRAALRRSGVRTRGQQRREIRKDIIRALQSLARISVA
jgi:hypothetical protein